MIRKVLAVAIAAVWVSGCATIFEGTTQEIHVVTNPPGGSCVFERQGVVIATIPQTPASAMVRKLKYDILIKCDKPGYQLAQYLNHSGTTAAIAGNVAADLILTAGLSSIIDSANGADNKYDSAVNITLVPVIASAPAAAPAVTTPQDSAPVTPPVPVTPENITPAADKPAAAPAPSSASPATQTTDPAPAK